MGGEGVTAENAHTRTSTGGFGPDFCKECSDDANDWVPWPCKAKTDLIADLRRLMAEERCLCSSAHTDWRGVSDLLDRLERAEQQVANLTSLAQNCEGRAAEDRATARAGGLSLGQIEGLEVVNRREARREARRDLTNPSASEVRDA